MKFYKVTEKVNTKKNVPGPLVKKLSVLNKLLKISNFKIAVLGIYEFFVNGKESQKDLLHFIELIQVIKLIMMNMALISIFKKEKILLV